MQRMRRRGTSLQPADPDIPSTQAATGKCARVQSTGVHLFTRMLCHSNYNSCFFFLFFFFWGGANKRQTFHNTTLSGDIQDRSSIYKDSLRNKWVYSIKGEYKPDTSIGRMRKYWEAEAGDVVEGSHGWLNRSSPPKNWLAADVRDDVNQACGGSAQLYNFDAIAYESVVVGLFSLIHGKHCNPPQPYGRGGEQDDVFVGFSRNGYDFSRNPVRTAGAFLPQSKVAGEWNFQNVQSTGGAFLVHKETLQFYVGARSGSCKGGVKCEAAGHGSYNGNGTTGTAFLRRDGFASVQPSPGAARGVVTTEVLAFDAGSHMFVNVNLTEPSSTLLVEVLDPKDESNPIKKTSLLVKGPIDSTAYHIFWEDHVGLEMLAGLPVRFRFTLTTGGEAAVGAAKLFSFWVSTNETTACSGGPVAAGGSTFTASHDLC